MSYLYQLIHSNDVVKWKDVRVGDVLRLENNDFITVRENNTCTNIIIIILLFSFPRLIFSSCHPVNLIVWFILRQLNLMGIFISVYHLSPSSYLSLLHHSTFFMSSVHSCVISYHILSLYLSLSLSLFLFLSVCLSLSISLSLS